jgi:hypothetical protein
MEVSGEVQFCALCLGYFSILNTAEVAFLRNVGKILTDYRHHIAKHSILNYYMPCRCTKVVFSIIITEDDNIFGRFGFIFCHHHQTPIVLHDSFVKNMICITTFCAPPVWIYSTCTTNCRRLLSQKASQRNWCLLPNIRVKSCIRDSILVSSVYVWRYAACKKYDPSLNVLNV